MMSEEACMIKVDGHEICLYPSERVLKLLGKDYTILIIGLLGNTKSIPFNEIARKTGGPRPNLLSLRLGELAEAGLVRREVIGSKPISVRYSLTEAGRELRSLMIPLFEWIERTGNKAQR